MRLIVCLPLLLFPVHGQPQQAPADSSAIQTLIQEVRLLRLAIEKSSTLVPRLQITLARQQTQQDRVDRLEEKLQTLRNQAAADSTSKENMAATLAHFDEQSRSEENPAIRKQLTDAAAGMRMELEHQTQREQQVRSQEAELVAQIKLEQAKLSELSNQLDQLDRKMQEQ